MSDRPDELRRQLATLWRAARTGFDSMREVVVRSGEAGRLRFDIAVMQRERAQLLKQLGERTCEFLDSADGEVPELMHQLRERIRDVESRIQSNTVKAYDNAFGAPRGFEPEAAEDYGDDPSIDDDPEVVEEKPVPKRRAANRTRRASSTRKRNGA